VGLAIEPRNADWGAEEFLTNLQGVVRAVTRANERDGSARPIRIVGRGSADGMLRSVLVA
jgi:hypothetical protein